MRVRLLSPYDPAKLSLIYAGCALEGDEIGPWTDPDITILYGHRGILKGPQLSSRIINLHISYLPYNRGASPNLWSWYDDTPKGVSIHSVTKKVDSGPILARRLVHFPNDGKDETLRTSYEKLQNSICSLFHDMWPFLRKDRLGPWAENNGGSYHTIAQSDELLSHFPDRYDTPVTEVARLGQEMRESVK